MAEDDGAPDSLTVRIRSDLKESLRKLAEAERRTLSQYVVMVLDRHVAAQAPKKSRR